MTIAQPKFSSKRVSGLTTSSASLVLQFVLQLVVGTILGLSYRPEAGVAHGDVSAMHGSPWEGPLQAFHYWGSAFLIAHCGLHLLAATWQGDFRPPHGLRYVSVPLMLLCALGFQLTGNLLPFDRHGAQTAAIELSILARAPGVGTSLSHRLAGGSGGVGPATLAIWYGLHRFALPVLLVATLAVAISGIRLNRNEGVRWPLAWIGPAIPLALAFLVRSPLGSPATSADYQAFAARSSWYVWPLHGLLALFGRISPSLGWVGAMVVPGLFLVLLLLLPLFARKLSDGTVRAGLSAFLTLFFVAAFGFGGSFAPLTGTRDPVVAATTAPASATSRPDPVLASKGRDLFNRMECADCHGKDGANGSEGPTLTQVFRRHPEQDYYIRYVQNPTSVNPDSTMPAFKSLTPDQLKQLADFLRTPR